jgi:hypothetical protein
MVSVNCRSEMEAAIESQTDVSPECKVEIQQAVQVLSGFNNDNQEEEEQPSETVATPPPRSGIHPGFWIAAFVVALVGGVTAYVVHVNKLLQEAFPPKPVKKLSKKKVNSFYPHSLCSLDSDGKGSYERWRELGILFLSPHLLLT